MPAVVVVVVVASGRLRVLPTEVVLVSVVLVGGVEAVSVLDVCEVELADVELEPDVELVFVLEELVLEVPEELVVEELVPEVLEELEVLELELEVEELEPVEAVVLEPEPVTVAVVLDCPPLLVSVLVVEVLDPDAVPAARAAVTALGQPTPATVSPLPVSSEITARRAKRPVRLTSSSSRAGVDRRGRPRLRRHERRPPPCSPSRSFE